MDNPPDHPRRVRHRLLWLAGLWLTLPLSAAQGWDDAPVPPRSLTAGEITGMTAARNDLMPGVAELAEELLALGRLKATESAPPMAVIVETSDATPIMEVIEVLKEAGARVYWEQAASMLKSPSPGSDARLAAIKILAAIGVRDEAAGIAALLSGDEPLEIRKEALRVLGELGAVEYGDVIAGMTDNSETAFEAIQALGKLGAVRHAPAILAVVIDESATPVVRTCGAEVLWRMGEMPAAESSRFVAGLLKDAKRANLNWILDLLVRMGAPESVEAILRQIGRDGLRRYDVPLYAVKTLTEFGFDHRCHEIAHFLASEEPDVCSGALAALRFFKAVEFTPQVAALLASGGPEKVRQDALVALAALQGRKALSAVIPLLAPEEFEDLQLLAVQYIEAWKVTEAAKAVAGLLSPHVSGKVREKALWTLVEIDGTTAVRDVAKLLDEHDHPVIRRQAAEVIAELRGLEAAPAVAGLLRDNDPNLQTAGLKSLAALGASDQSDAVAALLEDEKISVRREAVRTLGTLKATQYASPLVAMPGDRSMQTLVIATLGRMGAVNETPVLFRLLLDRDEDLRRRALGATVLRIAERVRTRDPLLRALRWSALALALQPVLWVLVFLLYPFFRPAQWMVWRPWFRRLFGLGWVGPVLQTVPSLRERLWRPFRESLVPPEFMQSFDDWTFMDSGQLVPVPPARADARPALPVLAHFRGVWILRGIQGSGKTTLLQSLAASSRRPVAFLHATECNGGILNALRLRLPAHAQGDPRFLKAMVRRGSPDIFVDAVDQASPDLRERLSREVESLPGANLLVTSQLVTWPVPMGAQVWELLPRLRTGEDAGPPRGN